MSPVRGRTCPLSYRHGPEALRVADEIEATTAWVAGGVYGNVEALEALIRRVGMDERAGLSPRLILNGDFHWFDIRREDFLTIEALARAQLSLAGNVEAELGDPDEAAGCGCAYPDFIDDAVVERSNTIMRQLQTTVAGLPESRARLAGLRRLLRLRIGQRTVGIIHGDPVQLAGWGLAIENLRAHGGATDERHVRHWAAQAGVDAFACSHTCLPWVSEFDGIVVANNGAAGLPNFRDRPHGLATRITRSGDQSTDALYAIESGGIRYEAIPIHYDTAAWQERFQRAWPRGSAAHLSYFERIRSGPRFRPEDARPATS